MRCAKADLASQVYQQGKVTVHGMEEKRTTKSPVRPIAATKEE